MDDALKKAVELLAISTYRAFSNSLGSSKAQIGYFERYREAKVGDMAFESSSINRCDPFTAIGRITKIGYEPREIEDWPDDEDIPEEHVIYLELLDGSEMRWTNCSFIKIPETYFDERDKQ